MKILYVTELIKHGGGGKATENLVLAMSKIQGFHVALFCIGEPFQTDSHIDLFCNKAKNPMTVRYVFGLIKAIRSYRPEIIHAMGMYTGILSILAVKMFNTKSKVFVTLHHTSEEFRYNNIAKKIIPLLNYADLLFYLTEYQRLIYMKYGLKPYKYYILPNIVNKKINDKEKVAALRNKLCEQTKSSFLLNYVGRLEESKQVDVFIKVIKKLTDRGRSVGGVIVGTGDVEYEIKMKEIAKSLNIEDHVVFIGFVNNPELYIEATDVGLFPTLMEALPNYIIESFSIGRILVVSNIPQLQGLVRNGINSLVVPHHNVDEYVTLTERIIEHGDEKAFMEREAKHFYEKEFSPEVVLNKYINTLSVAESRERSSKEEEKCVSA